jgi:L-aspartate oxidase
VKQYDVLIIGAGIAGLYTAMNLPEEMNVLVVCKDIPW